MYQKGIISQVVFNTKDSTFFAFSKAVACNQFGLMHEMDPQKDSYDFLLILDNDIILMPKWDKTLKKCWDHVNANKLKDIKVIGQLPGGIKHASEFPGGISGFRAKLGKLGGSGLWSVRTNFFRDIGYLPVQKLIGRDKMHDQTYWRLMDMSTGGKPYILGVDKKLGVHCGKLAGSICNILTNKKHSKNKEEVIKFKEAEEKLEKLSFDEFFEVIKEDNRLVKDW